MLTNKLRVPIENDQLELGDILNAADVTEHLDTEIGLWVERWTESYGDQPKILSDTV